MILGIESSCDETALSLLTPVRDFWAIGCTVRSKAMRIMAGWCRIWPSANTWPSFLPFWTWSGANTKCRVRFRKLQLPGTGFDQVLGIGLSVAKSLGLLWGVRSWVLIIFGVTLFSPFMGLALGKEDDWEDYLPHLGLLVSGGNTLCSAWTTNGKSRFWREPSMMLRVRALTKVESFWGFLIPVAPSLRERQGEGMTWLFLFRALSGQE